MWSRRQPLRDKSRRSRSGSAPRTARIHFAELHAPSSVFPLHHDDPRPDHEQKQAALSYLNEAWAEARHEGVDGDCLAQASLFAALAELVTTYGEDAVAKFVEGLAARVRNGEFSLVLASAVGNDGAALRLSLSQVLEERRDRLRRE